MSTYEKKRRKRHTRSTNSMRLMSRDVEILKTVHAWRVLEQSQLATLFFNGSKNAAQARLRKLFDNGYLARRFYMPPISPTFSGMANQKTLYVLDKAGAKLLRQATGEPLRASRKDKALQVGSLQHFIEINTVRAAVTLAVQKQGYTLQTWQDESTIKRETRNWDRVQIPISSKRMKHVTVSPDAYFAIEVPRGTAHFFLELDRGTEAAKQVQNKALAYMKYHATGMYERRYGTKALRILFVVPDDKRSELLKKSVEAVGGKQVYYFATLEHITPQTVLQQPIWQVAGRNRRVELLPE